MSLSGSAGLTQDGRASAAHEHGGAPRRERGEDATVVRDAEQPEVAEQSARADEARADERRLRDALGRQRTRDPAAANGPADLEPAFVEDERRRPEGEAGHPEHGEHDERGQRQRPPPVGGEDREPRDGRRGEQVRRRHRARYEIKASGRESHSPSRLLLPERWRSRPGQAGSPGRRAGSHAGAPAGRRPRRPWGRAVRAAPRARRGRTASRTGSIVVAPARSSAASSARWTYATPSRTLSASWLSNASTASSSASNTGSRSRTSRSLAARACCSRSRTCRLRKLSKSAATRWRSSLCASRSAETRSSSSLVATSAASSSASRASASTARSSA